MKRHCQLVACFYVAWLISVDLLNEEAGVTLADLLVESGKTEEAAALYTKVMQMDTNCDPRAAWAWFRSGQLQLVI